VKGSREKWTPPSAEDLFKHRYPSAAAGREALDAFNKWLLAEGVGERTARNYVQQVWASLMATGGDPMRDFLNPKFAKSTKLVLKAAWSNFAVWVGDLELEREFTSRRLRRVISDKRNTRASHALPGFGPEVVDEFLRVIDQDRHNEVAPWRWPVLRMMLILGLRAGVDLTWITRAAIVTALETGTLTIVSKGDKLRSLPAEPVYLELKWLTEIPGQWNDLAELIAPWYRGDSTRQHETAYAHVAAALKQYAEQLGLDPSEVHTHRFRRAAALRVYNATKDIVLVQQMLGHGRVTTTQRYLEDDRTAEIGEAIGRAYASRS
jgi:site-specific recombinase XerC